MPDWRLYVREHLRLPAVSPEREADIIEDLAVQLDEVFRDAVDRGASQDEALAVAQEHIPDWASLSRELASAERRHRLDLEVRLGDRLRESVSSKRWCNMLTWIAGDFLYAMRVMRKNPGFTLVTVCTLALGIGATTTLFSVVNAVLLRPLPFTEPDRLVRVISLQSTGEPGGVSYPDFRDWKDQSDVFDGIAVFADRDFVLSRPGPPTHVRGAAVSAELFAVLGVAANVGRTFVPEEEAPGAAGGGHAVLLSDRLWRDQFGADPGIVGQAIELDRQHATVVGVMPAGFRFPIGPEPVDLWSTMAVYAVTVDGGEPMTAQRGVHFLDAIARLKPNVTLEQATAQLSAIVRRLNQQHPENNPRGVLVRPELTQLVADVQLAWLVLLGASGGLLLMACANVASLLLARMASRRTELAVRAALGAGRRRLVLQLLIEHAVLAVLGGAAGLLLAYWGTHFLKLMAPAGVPRIGEVGMDQNVVLFAVVASLLTVMLFGLAPTLRTSRIDLAQAMNRGGRGQADHGGHRVRRALVVGQVALALVLLVGGGLLTQSLLRLQAVDLGFDPTHVLSFRVNLPSGYAPTQERAFHEQLLTGLRSLPGVRSASAVFGLPLSGRDISTGVLLQGEPAERAAQRRTQFNIVDPLYFHTVGIPMRKGRDFTDRDDLRGVPVAIVSDAFARRYFTTQDPIGQRIRPGIGNGYREEPWREVIGVVGDVRAIDLRSDPLPEVYVPAAQCPIRSATVVVRSEGEPSETARSAQGQVAALDKSIPIYAVKTVDQYLSAFIVQPRFNSLLLAAFAGLSLMLAAVGLYGLVGYSVARRTQEVGIRLALGATPAEVLRLILTSAAKISLLGIAIGLLAALVLTRWMSTLVFEVGVLDPLTFAGAALLLLCVALLACFLAARRVMRVDPVTALRVE